MKLPRRSAGFQPAVSPISNRQSRTPRAGCGLETRDTADWKSVLLFDITSRLRLLCLLCALCVLLRPSPALAHNPDTSYARVVIGTNEVTFRFTYDVFTLLKIASLDADNDRQVTRSELTTGLPAIHEFLRKHIAVDLNDEEAGFGEPVNFVWPPDAGDAIGEANYHAAASLIHFNFRLPVEDTPENVVLTFDFFTSLGERHTVLGSFNYQGEPHEVTFTRFEPDYDYVTGYETPLWRRLVKFFKLGVEHIFLGYDHIAFLIALIVVSRFKELVKIVTSFTVAHSITLILATLDVVQLNPRWVEIAIAGTIVYVALENLWAKSTRHRWMLTFVFGLIHGFGFANVLREMSLPTTGLVRCLLSFNVGVELGQLAIVLALLPVTLWLGKWPHGRKVIVAVSFLLALFGAAWFVERIFVLEFMPF
jgi:hydrogenase/urease accessory protein HupE